MAYNEIIARQMREALLEKGIDFQEKKMFGGLCFMVDDKMCCGLLTDKETDLPLMMCRVGENAFTRLLKKEHAREMNFSGRPMKGFIFVEENGFRSATQLNEWIQYCLDFNPLAKKSAKRK